MGDDHTTTHYRTCHLCEAMCGLELTVRGDEIVRVRGDRDDVFSAGYLCPKGASIGAVHASPDRLARPTIRTGDDPATATWAETEWDDAFALIADRLGAIIEQHGRDSVAIYVGNPSAHSHENLIFVGAVAKALGTKNFFSASTVDQMPKHVSSGLMFGDPDAIPVPDLDRTSYLLMLGANPLESNGSLCTAPDFPGRLKRIIERGGQVVVVDPRRTKTAELATQHLAVRPGTDAALLLSIASVLFADDLVDLGRLAPFTAGLDEVRAAVAPFTPERVATWVGIDAATIRRVAAELAAAPSAAVYARIGTHTNTFGTLGSWATDLVNVLLGTLDSPGGAMFARPPHVSAGKGKGRGFSIGRWTSRVRGAAEARSELPVSALPEEILTPGDGQIRALITVAGNPARSAPDSVQMEQALSSLEFMVSVDPWRNETTRHADVILPPPSPLTRSQYDIPFSRMAVRNIARWSPAVFDRGERPAEWEILSKLALIAQGMGPDVDPSAVGELVLGMQLGRAAASSGADAADVEAQIRVPGRSYPDMVVDAMISAGIWGNKFGQAPDGLSLAALTDAPHGIDLGALQPELPAALKTPSGMIELWHDAFVPELARLEAALDAPVPPLVLVGRRHLRSNNSWMHNVPRLVTGKPRCTLQVSPVDAESLGLIDAGLATVTSAAGSVEATVEITDAVIAGVVSLPHGWGHDGVGTATTVATAHPGVNSNALTDGSQIDPLSGNAQLNAIPVTVAPFVRPAAAG